MTKKTILCLIFPEITNEDLVLGIRPEFIDIADEGNLRGEIYGAMPTGMESTIKVRVGVPADRRRLRQLSVCISLL